MELRTSAQLAVTPTRCFHECTRWFHVAADPRKLMSNTCNNHAFVPIIQSEKEEALQKQKTGMEAEQAREVRRIEDEAEKKKNREIEEVSTVATPAPWVAPPRTPTFPARSV